MASIPETPNPILDWFNSVPEDAPIDFGRLYTLCNETNKESVLQTIATRILAAPTPLPTPPSLQERVHIGFSSQFNYDIMALSKPSYALICDVNPKMLEYYRTLEHCIHASPDRQTFVTRMLDAIPPEDQELFSLELHRPNSWLSADSSYEYIRKMYLMNRIRHRCLNAASPSLEQLAHSIPPMVKVDTIYASNIYEWLENEGFEKRDQFKKSMKNLLSLETLFIDARYLTGARTDSGPPLRITPGLPNYASEKRAHRS